MMHKGKGAWGQGGGMTPSGSDYGFAAGYGGGFGSSGKSGIRQTYGQAPLPANGKGAWGKEASFGAADYGYMAAGKGGWGGASFGKGGKAKNVWGEVMSDGTDAEKPKKKAESTAHLYFAGHLEGFAEAVHEALEPHIHLDTTWPLEEAEKRVSQYITKASKRYTKDERTVQRATPAQAGAVVEEFVHSSLQAVSAGCYDKPWFYEADFREVLYIAAVGTFKGRKLFARTLAPTLRTYVEKAIFGWSEDVRVEKAMREAIEHSGIPDSFHKKAMTYLTKSHEDAQISAPYGETGPHTGTSQELGMMQDFVTGWIRGFVGRSWDVLTSGVGGGTEEHVIFVTALFHSVTDPDKCCVPHELTSACGGSLPPKEWIHVAEAVHAIFMEVEEEASRAPNAKKMKKGGGKGGKNNSGDDAEGMGAASADRHPQCTNDMACIGSVECPLVRHVMDDGAPGDIYCQMCWDAVVESRPGLNCEFVA